MCKYLHNINFHSVKVPEPEKYDILAKHGGGWVGEAYFHFVHICFFQIA
ncbi:hypothetical protein NBRC111894_3539 [Sporolactobacillus inulinus]|uniref:Uncharacterized protein n=1 Tax=Sporolactobacillus inulinus TaxID=2078 RepID=A0A4Y1ZFV7_9BACL|nr:hypothetical protein NBRC111894_3539 [Sporolactobacillus inulinus]